MKKLNIFFIILMMSRQRASRKMLCPFWRRIGFMEYKGIPEKYLVQILLQLRLNDKHDMKSLC